MRCDDKTVVRGAFGIVFDNWAAVTQMAQNIEGAWPDIGQQIQTHLNEPTSATPTPTVQAQNPLVASGSGLFPPATPFTNNTWFYDPHIKNPYSEQWNLGVQRQLNSSTALTINYVGSGSHRTNVGGYYNTALTPGPGDIRRGSLILTAFQLFTIAALVSPITTLSRSNSTDAIQAASPTEFLTRTPKR